MAAEDLSGPMRRRARRLWRAPHTAAAGTATIRVVRRPAHRRAGDHVMRAHPDHRPRRFSEGQEHTPGLPASARVGRFSDGLTGLLADAPGALRVGTFADGSVLRPDAPAVRRIGGFARHVLP